MDEFRMFTVNDDGKITNIEVIDPNVVHAILAERERIKAKIMDRVIDLKSCGKNDNCYEFGDLIESYIEEWLE